MVMKFTKEDAVLVQIGAMIGYLEEKRGRIEREEHGPQEIGPLADKIEAAWEVLCRRNTVRGGK